MAHWLCRRLSQARSVAFGSFDGSRREVGATPQWLSEGLRGSTAMARSTVRWKLFDNDGATARGAFDGSPMALRSTATGSFDGSLHGRGVGPKDHVARSKDDNR